MDTVIPTALIVVRITSPQTSGWAAAGALSVPGGGVRLGGHELGATSGKVPSQCRLGELLGSCPGLTDFCAVKGLRVSSERHPHHVLPTKQVDVKPVRVILRIKVRFLLQIAQGVKTTAENLT